MNSHCVVAIDGPAASGKSTVAREVARRLGFVYVNSGAMYRAITWHLLEQGFDGTNLDPIPGLIEHIGIRCHISAQVSRVLINDVDPAAYLRQARVNNHVSQFSAVPAVRRIVDELMRGCARNHNLVVEGRDIGSVVFPETPYKF